MCVIDTLHRFHDRHQSKYIVLAVNVSDEELGVNKRITICFACITDLKEIHHSAELTKSVNEINDVGAEKNESATNESLPKVQTLIPLNSSFIFHKDFTPNLESCC